MVSQRRGRRIAWLGILAILLAGIIPLSASASSHHTATRTSITFTSTTVEVLEDGEEWQDEAGIFHFRNNVIRDEVTGDISGTATITLNGDFQPVGECTEDDCSGYFGIWGRLEIEGEEGGWVGTYAQLSSDVPDAEFFADALVLRGTGGNAHMSIFADSSADEGDDEESITFEGVLSSLATPIVGLNTQVSLCLDPEDFSFGGGFLSTGAIEGHGAAFGEFLVGGGPWAHTYAVGGVLELTDEHGSVTFGFVGGAQDAIDGEVFASHVGGHWTIVDGTGDYAELYGSGRLIAAAMEPNSTCASNFGLHAYLIGEAHYNSMPAVNGSED